MAVFVVTLFVVVTSSRLYADSGTWVDGEMPVLELGQQLSSLPSAESCIQTTWEYFTYSTQPNSIGNTVDTSVCATQNQLGFFGKTSGGTFIKPNTATAFRTLRSGKQISLTPVPSQAAFILQDNGPFTRSITPRFYYNFASNGDFGQHSYGTNITNWDLAYNLETSGEVLKDGADKTIYMWHFAFSQNGQWMVIEVPGQGLLRVNTLTRETQLFSLTTFRYDLGFAPYVDFAISDDGNSVILAANGGVTAYDINGCQPGVFTIGAGSANSAAMEGCQSRILTDGLRSQLPGFLNLYNMHFSADGKSVRAVAQRQLAGGSKEFFKVTVSVAGYQAPHVGYMALGDSFASGEGAYDYEQGTDNTNPRNKCHLSKKSYPYLAAQALNITAFHSVACSGAKDSNYHNEEQGELVPGTPLGKWLPGVKAQKLYMQDAGEVSVITISMIGNDIAFADKLKTCIVGTSPCYHFLEDRKNIATEIYGKFDELVQLYKDIKHDSNNEENVKIYVMGYPQIFGTEECGLNVSLDLEERQMAQGLTSYLNAVIKAAAEKSGVQYIDTEHAFDDHRLCGVGDDKAVNGFALGDDEFIDGVGPIGNESYHPNKLGHSLMSEALLQQSQDFSKPMPAANDSKHAPYTESIEYNNFLGEAPAGGSITRFTYAGIRATELASRTIGLRIDLDDNIVMMPSQQVELWLNSDPTYLGTLNSDEFGKVIGEVTIPASVEPGYHTLHMYGQNVGGEEIDVYKVIYVAASFDDYNGDGVPNSEDPCLILPSSGVDGDYDGVDDACDGDLESEPIDTVPPNVTGTPDRQPDHDGWYAQDVPINWAVNDPAPSSGAPSQPEPTIANQEGSNTYASSPSCDPAGNCVSGSIDIKLDKTAPDITYTLSSEPNAAGWNNSPVTVTFTCTDATSGVKSCSEPVTITADGAIVVTGIAVDNAANSTGVNVIVAIDTNAPQITSAVSSEANENGWHNSDVTVTPTCTDGLSGVATCSPSQTITSEGGDQVVVGRAVDNAGNEATIITSVNLDKTAPEITSVTWTDTFKLLIGGESVLSVKTADNLSGAVAAEYFVGDTDPGFGNGTPMQLGEEGFSAKFASTIPITTYNVNVRIKDAAGNWSTLYDSKHTAIYVPLLSGLGSALTLGSVGVQ